MPRLSRIRAGESGNVIVLMAVAVVVLVGMAALVIDVGAGLDEKRQLQNGADAAALAVAQRCALRPCNGTAPQITESNALAEDLAGDNARDNKGAVSVSYPQANQVQVIASTDGSSGAILPYSFGQALTGQEGRTVRAKATASWGPAGSAIAVPLAVSECDLIEFRKVAPDSPMFFAKNGPCGSTDAPGAFGWLDNPCATIGEERDWTRPTYRVGEPAAPDPGKSGPKDCLDGLKDKDVILPVFKSSVGTDKKVTHTIVGFAAVHLTGWDFPGDWSTKGICNQGGSCIKGTFINFVIPGPPGVGTGFGVSTVSLVS